MRVPLLDLSQQYAELAGPIKERIERVLASQRFILGENVAGFEKAMCELVGVPHAIGVSSGTDALLLTLMALEIGPGDAVLTSAYSFFGTAGSIARVGARPVFVDIDPATYNVSGEALARYIDKHCREKNGVLQTENGAAIRAIMPVHLFGLCSEMDPIHEISERYQLEVIEDAAQAIGAECPTKHMGVRKAGTMGEVGCFSFYPSKNLGAAGDAGLVVCRDDALAKQLRIYRQHGMEPRYFHHVIGGNFRLDEIQAAILDVKLPHLNGWSAARREAADFYGKEFVRAGLADKITLPTEPYRDRGLANHHIYHQYIVRTSQRDALRQHLTKREIGTEIYYPLGLHEQKCFQYLGYKPGDFPETERAARETLALPMYPEISREAQSYVVGAIAEFFR